MKKIQANKTKLFCIFFMGILLFLLWRVRYGIANVDECYYISIPYRFYQGDSMFVEEWGIIQLSSFLMYPFVWIYMLIVGSTDGILLNFRYIYTFVCAICSWYIYYRMKKENWLAATVSSLCLMLYAPFGIAALSYNSICILLLSMISITLATSDKISVQMCWLIGILFSGAVLCCPFLAIPFVIYVCTVFFFFIISRNKKGDDYSELYCRNIKIAFGMLLGCITVGIFFVIFAVKNASLNDIIFSLPYIVNDGNHSMGFMQKVVHFFWDLAWSYRFILPILAVELLMFVIVIQTKKDEVKRKCLIIALFLTFISEVIVWVTIHYINFIFWPVNVLAILCFGVYYNDKNIMKYFKYVCIPGFIYSICLHFSSNQSSYAITSASTVAAIGGIMIIFIAYRNLLQTENNCKKCSNIKIAMSMVFLMLLLEELEIRYANIFWDTNIKTQTEYIDEGPEKGIIASKQMSDSYYYIYSHVSMIEKKYEVEDALFVTDSFQTLYYLIGDVNNSSCSSWLPEKNRLERMEAYYSINPEKKPQMIYISKDSDGTFLSEMLIDYELVEDTAQAAVYINK